jgi:drug/metabolite transporter (DMT)-like permease
VGALLFGWLLFGEHLTWLQALLAAVLIASAVIAALGTHAAHEIQPDVKRGGIFMAVMALLMAIIAVLLRDLAEDSHPLLMAWAWEFGSGLVLVGPLLWIYRRGCGPFLPQRIWQIALASSPTVVGSGANVMALTLGKLGLWGALGGTQVLFTAVLGAWWHRETVGARRWLCFAAAAAAIAGLSLSR